MFGKKRHAIMSPEFERAKQAVYRVDGMLRDTEGWVLYQLAKKSKAIIVEIGSWKGKSTIWLRRAPKQVIKARFTL